MEPLSCLSQARISPRGPEYKLILIFDTYMLIFHRIDLYVSAYLIEIAEWRVFFSLHYGNDWLLLIGHLTLMCCWISQNNSHTFGIVFTRTICWTSVSIWHVSVSITAVLKDCRITAEMHISCSWLPLWLKILLYALKKIVGAAIRTWTQLEKYLC